MGKKAFFVTALLFLPSTLSMTGGETGRWEVHTYPGIGLRIELPHLEAQIKDEHERWFLSALPVPKQPYEEVPYKLQISVKRLPEAEYAQLIHGKGTNSAAWASAAHLRTAQRSNDFWILTRKDVRSTNGFVYRVEATIRRLPRRASERASERDSDAKLAADVLRILDSVQVAYER